MSKANRNHILTRFILFFNIVFVALLVILIILFNNSLSGLQIPPYLRETLQKINILIFLFAFLLILFNAYLLINHLFYNTKQYFKLLEKIDFNDLPSAVGILNSTSSMDEYGDLGKNITKLLKVYLNYANGMRKRLGYQDKKFKTLIEQSKIPLMVFDRNRETKDYDLSFIGSGAKPLLELENSSAIVGKPLTILFSKETLNYIQQLINQNPRETLSNPLTMLIPAEWIKPSLEKDGREETFISFNILVIPFSFQFSDNYEYEDPKTNPSNFNSIVDTFFLLIQKNPEELKDSENSTPSEEDSLKDITDSQTLL